MVPSGVCVWESLVIGVKEPTKNRKPGPGFEAAAAHRLGLEWGQGAGAPALGYRGEKPEPFQVGQISVPAGPSLSQLLFLIRHLTV